MRISKKFSKQRSILITGGAGFIGSHLCSCLLKHGHKVVCFDNFFTGSLKNLRGFLNDKNFKVVKGEVENFKFKESFDQIYNLACPASPVAYQRDPVKTLTSSTLGAINMLELAKRCGSRILQTSTSEIYGDPLQHPQKETYRGNVSCLGPRACYDEGKRCAETFFMDYHRKYGVDIKIIRIFNTYGPKMAADDGRVVSNFIVQALNNKNITIYGGGKQTRSFQYVDDLISGMVKMMNADDFIGPVNIGNPDEFTIKELAENVINLTGAKSRIIYKPLPVDDPKQRRPDITLAKKKLGWKPEIKLEEGLLKTIDYFKETLHK